MTKNISEEENVENEEFKVIGSEGKDEFFKVIQKGPRDVKLTK